MTRKRTFNAGQLGGLDGRPECWTLQAWTRPRPGADGAFWLKECPGVARHCLHRAPAAKKEIASTRSFGRPITELADLVEAVSEFAGRAAEKLRRQNGKVTQLMTFVHTPAFKMQDKQQLATTMPTKRLRHWQ
jgi:hypothetical protein